MEDVRTQIEKIDDNQNEEENLDTENENVNLLSPLCTGLKADSKLTWNDFKHLLQVTYEDSVLQCKSELDVDVFPSPHILVELSQKVYNIKESAKSDEEYEKELDLPEGWKLLTTAANEKNCYYGAAFWNSELRQLVIAHKGTNSLKDIFTDIKAIICDDYAGQMNSAMTFADHVINTTSGVIGSNWQLAFTGHSLGGWLAQITCFSAKFLCKMLLHEEWYFVKTNDDGIHTHCVTFDSPGCENMLRKLTKDFDLRCDGVIDTDKLDITTYLSAPNKINTYNFHFGTVYRVLPDFTKLNIKQKYVTYTPTVHNIDLIADIFAEKIGNIRIPKPLKIVEVVDWPYTTLLRTEEYSKFFEWAGTLNNYHITDHPHECKVNEHTVLRYQTKEVKENCCKFSVFSSHELNLLKCLEFMRRQNTSLPKIEEFFKNNRLSMDDILQPNFDIHEEKKKKLSCQSKYSLRILINRTKQIMRRFYTSLTQAVKDQIENWPSAVEYMYTLESNSFLETIPQCNVHFEDVFELRKFVKYDKTRIMCIATDDLNFDVMRIHNICEHIQKPNKHSTEMHEKNSIQKINIVLGWQNVLNLKKYIFSHNKLVTKCNMRNLLIIVIPSKTDIHKENEHVLNDLLSETKGKNCRKLIFVTSKECNLMNYITSKYSGEQFFMKDATPFCFSDVTPESQDKILEKPLLELEGTSYKLGQLFYKNDDSSVPIQGIFDRTMLKKLVFEDRPLVKVQNLKDLYEDGCYVKIGVSVLKENAVDIMCNTENILKKVTKSIIFCIDVGEEECRDSEKLLELLNVSNEEQAEKIKEAWSSKKVVTIEHKNAETNFKQLCRNYCGKRIYWLELEGKTFFWYYVYDSDFYISRKLNEQFYVQHDVCEIFEGKSYSDIFVLSTSNKKLFLGSLEEKVDTGRLFTYCNHEEACRKFEELKNFEHPVHLIRVNDNTQKLILVRSSGSMDSIRKYVMKYDSIEENSLTQTRNKMMLFSGAPGVGKSTAVFSLCKQMKSTWVIQKELKNCQLTMQLPLKLDMDGVVSFLLSDNPLDVRTMLVPVLKEMLTKTCYLQVLLIFDGFDEIRIEKNSMKINGEKNSQEKFIQLLEYLKEETTANIWITSRTFLSGMIEKKFSIFATEIDEFNADERNKFLTSIWSSRLSIELKEFGQREEKLLEKYVQELFKQIEYTLGKNVSKFIGAPLQMWMIAEVAAPKGEIFINKKDSKVSSAKESAILWQKNDIYALYRRYIEEKYDIYFQKSGLSRLRPATRGWLIDILNEKHKSLGFLCLFGNVSEQFLRSKLINFCDESVEEQEEIEMNTVGIIQSNFCGEFKFLHQTFAEFFVAELFMSWLEKENDDKRYSSYVGLINDVLLITQFRLLRLFMNNLLAVRKLTNGALKCFALCFWNEYHNKRVKIFNDNYQTVLHVALEEHCANIVKLFLNISDSVYFRNTFPELTESLIFIAAHDSFGHSALYLAAQLKNDDIISRFIQLLNKSGKFVQKRILLSTLYGGNLDMNDTHIDYLSKLISRDGNESVQDITSQIKGILGTICRFMEAVKQGDAMEVKKILNEFSDSVTREYFLLVRDHQEKSALHLASERGFTEIVEFLLNQKFPVNDVDQTGFTPLHLAAMKGHLSTIQLLHSHGSNIFVKDAYNRPTLVLGAGEGHLSVVDYLLRNGMDLNEADSGGSDALQYASRNGFADVVKCLIQHGANVNHENDFGATALSYALEARHRPVVLELLKHMRSSC